MSTAPSIPKRDRFTFQYAELHHGQSSALAVASVAEEFIRSYQSTAHYEVILSALIENLIEMRTGITDVALKNLEKTLGARLNELLTEERNKDKSHKGKKWAPVKPRVHLDESSADEDADLTPEQIAQRQAEEEAADARREEEQRLAEERYIELQRRREENEKQLQSRARRVDTSAFDTMVKKGGLVLLNAGTGSTKKRGDKGPTTSTLSPEETGKLFQDVAEVGKEKERLKTVLSTSSEDIPRAISLAKTSLAEMAESASKNGPLVNNKVTISLNKAQIIQMQQKLAKLRMERDRLHLQLASEGTDPQRNEFLDILAKLDNIAVQLELAEA